MSVVVAGLGCTTDSSGLGPVEQPDAALDSSIAADVEIIDSASIDTNVALDTTPPPLDTEPAPDTSDAGCSMTTCGGACIDTTTSFENCGGCGKTCASTLKYSASCFEGNCECRTGESGCGAECKVQSEDSKNCGACGKSCAKAEWCRASACECRPGLTSCSGACVDTTGDLFNCGACGATCMNNQRCVAGSCVSNMTDCPMGQSACNADKGRSSCFNLQTDATHCGACGTACNADQLCVAGKCVKYAPAAGCMTCGGCATCTALLGSGARCCPALTGHALPTCVDGTACP